MPETIKSIPLDELHPFPDHPFGVRDDESMQQTIESVKEYGVIVPAMKAGIRERISLQEKAVTAMEGARAEYEKFKRQAAAGNAKAKRRGGMWM